MRELLQAILADPADDVLRLVYADWLEENGQGERAEFIRVQVGLAAMPECGSGPDRTGIPGIPCNCPWHVLRRRERELLTENDGLRWAMKELPAGWFRGGEVVHPWYWERGFVGRVKLPLASFLGGPCGGSGEDTRSNGPPWGCLACGGNGHKPGTGRLPGCAAELFAAQPVTAVRLSDREPSHTGHWFDERVWAENGGRDNLPNALFVLLGGGELVAANSCRIYASKAAAHAALSAASVAHGRALAGL